MARAGPHNRARGGGSDGTALGRGGSGAFGLERGDGDGGELEVDVKLGFWPNLFFFNFFTKIIFTCGRHR